MPPSTTSAAAPLAPVRVWDLPTRLFHWSLVLTIAGSLASAWAGDAWMQWHLRCGLAALILLAFRLVWGFVGGRWSRWSSFVYKPSSLVRYLRRQGVHDDFFEVGHSPTGALSVFALIAVLLAQVGTGLVANDDIATTGPLNRYVANATAEAATAWHKGWGQWLILGLIGLHVAAVVAYLARRNNLVVPMLRGDKRLPPGTPAARDDIAMRIAALVLLAACIALGAFVFSLADG